MGRAFGFCAVLVVAGIVLYLYSVQLKSDSAAVGQTPNPKAVANVIGVQNDLVSFANAERGYLASEGRYGSMDELTAGKYITISKERPPFTYDIETTSSGFQVTATRNDGGSPSKFTIDESMQVQQSN
ncbi:MAG TPA: hypothetical protein VGF44_02825 [Terriglobales bacterium]|jgi:hypothetical protein